MKLTKQHLRKLIKEELEEAQLDENDEQGANLEHYEEKLLTIYRDLGNYLEGMATRGVMGKEIQATRGPTKEYLEHPLYKGFAEARTGLGVMIKFLRNELKEVSKP